MRNEQLTLSLVDVEHVSAEECALVACLLSRWMAGLTDDRFSSLHSLVRALKLWGSTAVYVDGELARPRCEGIAAWQVTAPEGVMRKLGVSKQAIDEQWRELEERHGRDAHLPIDLLMSLVPVDFWRVIVAFVEDGPAVASTRLARALDAEGRRVMPPTRRFPQGRLIARGTLQGYRAVLRRMMRTVVELHANGYDSELLDGWVHLPSAPPIRGGRVDVARPAPTLLHMRQVWRWWAEEVERRYGCPIGMLPDRVLRMTDRQLRAAGPIALKNFVILTLFVLTGGRLAALSRLRRGDFRPEHVMRDGSTAPVILLCPRKRTDAAIVRPKRLPADAAALVQAWLIVAERHYGWPASEDDPLMPGTKAGRAMAYSSYRKSMMGDYGGKKPRIAIVPKYVETLGKRPSECDDKELCGFNPHALRRFADQTARQAAKDWVAANAGPADRDDIAEVLLDHRILKDPYGYAGISSEEGREHYSGIAIAGIWRLLTTDDGARKIVDADALRAALRERSVLEAELTRLRHQIDRHHEDLRAAPLSSAKRTKDVGLLVELIGKQAELSRMIDAERRARDRLHDVEREIDQIKHDPARLIALRDDAPASAANVTAEMIELDETGMRSIRGRPVRRVRAWLTPREFASWFGVGEATARRWLRGQGLRPGDPGAPWEPGDVPVIEISARRRVILVDKIKPTCVTDVARLDALEVRLATWPAGWPLSSLPADPVSVSDVHR